ncbi:hypothetical protein PIIN_03257 [Serendipita indica DSM 11827]|uniref:F-box domain-containing protein n=1 Tax=Serendipita indica (strain DSM 11827) TaxID=1109443 RepID=G4TDI0_SERID|nr:hypothetical protein PIIN_03257 [Serendipita indica DSM 11827]
MPIFALILHLYNPHTSAVTGVAKRMAHAMKSVHSLNRDVLIIIAEHLSVADLVAMSQTTRSWHSLSRQESSFWRYAREDISTVVFKRIAPLPKYSAEEIRAAAIEALRVQSKWEKSPIIKIKQGSRIDVTNKTIHFVPGTRWMLCTKFLPYSPSLITSLSFEFYDLKSGQLSGIVDIELEDIYNTLELQILTSLALSPAEILLAVRRQRQRESGSDDTVYYVRRIHLSQDNHNLDDIRFSVEEVLTFVSEFQYASGIFSPDGRLFVIESNGQIDIYDLQTLNRWMFSWYLPKYREIPYFRHKIQLAASEDLLVMFNRSTHDVVALHIPTLTRVLQKQDTSIRFCFQKRHTYRVPMRAGHIDQYQLLTGRPDEGLTPSTRKIDFLCCKRETNEIMLKAFQGFLNIDSEEDFIDTASPEKARKVLKKPVEHYDGPHSPCYLQNIYPQEPGVIVHAPLKSQDHLRYCRNMSIYGRIVVFYEAQCLNTADMRHLHIVGVDTAKRRRGIQVIGKDADSLVRHGFTRIDEETGLVFIWDRSGNCSEITVLWLQ